MGGGGGRGGVTPPGRYVPGNSSTITAGQLKQPGALDNMIHHDQGFKFLRAVRGSPPYFEKAKKDIFAMIRQLGSASLFCSFSSAETQWTHLLRILGKLVDNKTYTDLENLNWEEKSRLIQSDPVTCARHFDYRPSATHEYEAGKQVSFPPTETKF